MEENTKFGKRQDSRGYIMDDEPAKSCSDRGYTPLISLEIGVPISFLIPDLIDGIWIRDGAV